VTGDDLLGPDAAAWLALSEQAPPESIRLVLCDVDGVITRGEGQPAELFVLERLIAINRLALEDPLMPAVTLCTGRQAPYVELMAQMTGTFLPCIFEHGAGLFFPSAFRFSFHPRLGVEYAQRVARLRQALEEPLLRPGRAFVQPGKEATVTLYPLDDASLDELMAAASAAIADLEPPGFTVARNVLGVELRPLGIDKGSGAHWLSKTLTVPPERMAGVGDSDPDIVFLEQLGTSAAPANATPAVQATVAYTARAAYGEGLLEILSRLERYNREL
jgi:hydroxymethylpyrimidine pyrophosphatase-like HAD family hydrolase